MSALILCWMGLVWGGGEEYLPGGPLAGLRLPPFPTQHGEPPGYPGCLPGKYDGNLLAPEHELYPGSVEHWRAYMFKYMPIRSFFDRQSQLKCWMAPDLPGAEPSQVEQYAAPLYFVPRHDAPVHTGLTLAEVPVVRCRPGGPVFRLDLGELDVGLYAVRVIGAVETARLRPFREPLLLRAEVNDGPAGETSRHRLRLGYCDEFYSVAEVYFHAPVRRGYRMELQVDEGSRVDLLVHTIALDDLLAGVRREALKQRTTIAHDTPPAPAGDAKLLPADQRRQRDDAIWDALPPVNRQATGHTMLGGDEGSFRRNVAFAADRPAEAIEAEHGRWERPGRFDDPACRGLLLVNQKLGLTYTMDDLRQHRPLPLPYPYPDDGTGLFYPAADKPDGGSIWSPVAGEVSLRVREYPMFIHAKVDEWRRSGDAEAAHDAALALARWAYDFPTRDFANTFVAVARDPGPYGRDYRCRRRETVAFFLPHYPEYVSPVLFDYDRLFAFIRGNPRLAEAVGRYIPWVKTPEDVTRLIDGYLVQTTAKRILRYHYHTDPMEIANLAAIVGDTRVTDPWMEWLFSRTFIYPLPVAGIQDAMISGTTREGTEIVGSSYYAQGEGAARVAESLDLYRAAGGNARYDLSDPARYPKPSAHALWRIENVVAGADFLRIGDVAGPDKVPGHTLRDLAFARSGWRWTGDPRFAFILRHYGGVEEPLAADQAGVQAAAGYPRAPWLENRSRVLPMWAGVLETGLEHDDPRFRRAAYLRIGYGTGHQHEDTLDLQIVAHGLPMTIDGGQRSGYSTPGDAATRVHNTVEVDGRNHRDHSWVNTLADHEGARYLAATAVPPAGVTEFRRQIALIDVDEGRGARKLSPAEQAPGAALPADVVTPHSYVLDVFRVAGGAVQTYGFHGPLADEVQWNAAQPAPPAAGSPEAEYLQPFRKKPELSLAGDAPPLLEATWRYAREGQGTAAGEMRMLGANFNPDGPRKYTRLHLFAPAGARALRAAAVCNQWNYDYTQVMVQRRATAGTLETAWPAVIEPYAGQPFITDLRRLAVASEADDAGQAVAVEVALASGRKDVCLAAGRPEEVRSVPEASLRAAGEFAFVSTDGEGLRQAVLVGGTLLETPQVRLAPAAAERRATVTAADYRRREITLDRPLAPGVFEIGLPVAGRWTTYTAHRCEPAGAGCRLTVTAGADYYRSAVEQVLPDGTVVCTLKPLLEYAAGCRHGWTATDDEARRAWRADYLGERKFRLAGGPADPAGFGPAGVLRLWEYGVGDEARQRTSVALRRTAAGVFTLESDVEVMVGLKGDGLETSTDGATWQPAGQREGEWYVALLPAGQRMVRVP